MKVKIKKLHEDAVIPSTPSMVMLVSIFILFEWVKTNTK